MKQNRSNSKRSSIADNRRARFDIAVEQSFEAGISLTGDEIKSVRADRVQLQGAYVKLMYGNRTPGKLPQVLLIGMHLALAKEPQRSRLLLLNKKEVQELEMALATKGKTAVPLSLHFKRGWLKVVVGVGSGRKAYDKRELLKQRDLDRQQRSVLRSEKRP